MRPLVKKMLLIGIGICFTSLIPTLGFTTSIDFECTYDYVRNDQFINNYRYLKKRNPIYVVKYRKKKWWEDDRKMMFSINIQDGKVTKQFPIDLDSFIMGITFSAEIYPNYIILVGYSKSLKKYQDSMNKKVKTLFEFNINRIDGRMVGTKWIIDEHSDPGYKYGDAMYLHGNCKSIKRLF